MWKKHVVPHALKDKLLLTETKIKIYNFSYTKN